MKIFKMALLCIFMGLAGMGLAIPAAAQGADDTPLSTGYASVEDVPLILLQEMRSEMSRERFISQVLGP
ncbi:MAG TPA: hypothetical protein VHP34_00995, partial [Alphaproteobacteria bacterium]|nr:hypothetical protein [Alphaproteobacteria bacterium]